VKRYIAYVQRVKQQSEGVSEDDVNEIKQDISSFRYELLEILRNAGFDTGHDNDSSKVTGAASFRQCSSVTKTVSSAGKTKRRTAQAERRMMKSMQVGLETSVVDQEASRCRVESESSFATGTGSSPLPLDLGCFDWPAPRRSAADELRRQCLARAACVLCGRRVACDCAPTSSLSDAGAAAAQRKKSLASVMWKTLSTDSQQDAAELFGAGGEAPFRLRAHTDFLAIDANADDDATL